MPIDEDGFTKLTKSEIVTLLEDELETQFGADIDLSESSVFSTLIDVFAEVQSSEQEVNLEEVYNSAFVETAEGSDLDKVVALIGLQRRAAVKATGTVVLSRDDVATQDYLIQSGTEVQTNDDDPTVYETIETATIDFHDGFEDGDISEYSGDTGNASVQSSVVYAGSNALTIDTTDDVGIYRTDLTSRIGDILSCRVRTDNAADSLQYLFGTQTLDDTYFVEVDFSGTFSLKTEIGGSESTVDSDTGLSLNADEWYRIEVNWQLPDTTDNSEVICLLYDSNDTLVSQISGNIDVDANWFSGGIGFRSGSSSGNKYFDNASMRATAAEVRAIEGGAEGNIGASTLTVLPIVPTGVDSVNNPYPVGDSDYKSTDMEAQVNGRDQESDDQLRTRAQRVTGEGGDATVEAITSNLVNNVSGVQSVEIFENETDADNTGGGGLPPHSFEVVVFGGNDDDIAQAIFDEKAATARSYGGSSGTLASGSAQSETTGQVFNIDFSRPNALNVDVTLDIVVDNTYIGDSALTDEIVEYIGGTDTDGNEVIGLGVGSDVLIDAIEDIVIGDDTGVIGIVSISTTPSITTDGNGLEIVDVGASEVAQTDGTDGSITITTTEV